MGNTLKVPGATLYYETSGSGPVLLFIGGGTCDTSNFAAVGALLEDRYTVVRYDRRGNSRSTLDGPPEDQRVEDHADDAIRLLEHLTDEPANLVGSSSGALIALDVVARRPDLVRRAVPHEAPAFALTPDRDAHMALLRHALEEFERGGPEAGMRVFGDGTGLPDDVRNGSPEMRAAVARIEGNAPFFFRHEMLPFVAYEPDLDALAKSRQRVVPAVGAESLDMDTPPVQAMRIIAKGIDTEIAVFPGSHVGYMSDPGPFAGKLVEVLDP